MNCIAAASLRIRSKPKRGTDQRARKRVDLPFRRAKATLDPGLADFEIPALCGDSYTALFPSCVKHLVRDWSHFGQRGETPKRHPACVEGILACEHRWLSIGSVQGLDLLIWWWSILNLCLKGEITDTKRSDISFSETDICPRCDEV